ncbi:MAG: LacI family DNA-binding transcriptional regulator [Lachnospiraceae bacterium]|nr:LacI family DNA-binding transcriptional regulator [Lachnospiraceae bacterium]
MATIKEIAEIVGTSTTTVSNVLHGKLNKVSKEMVEKVQRVVDEQNYVLPMGMSVLTSKRSAIIGVVIWIPTHYESQILADPFYGNVVGALERVISDAGYYMMLYSSRSMNDIYRMAKAWNVDGLIALTFNYEKYQKLTAMVKKPVVAIDISSDLRENVYNIGIADEEGGYLMTQYLIRCGFEKIFILAKTDAAMDHLRYRGYRRALQEAGIPNKKENFIILSDYAEKRKKNYDRMIESMEKDCALFFLSDMLAIEAMGHFQKRGLRVPEDVSIVGYDDIELASMVTPALTTVRQNVSQKGEAAARMLLDILDGKQVEEPFVMLPVGLSIRESVRKRNKIEDGM